MRLPLIVASRPSIGFVGAPVVLPAGVWTFTSNSSDTVLVLETPTGQVELQDTYTTKEKTIVTIRVLEVGSESSITIYACRSL